ncbi:MAG: LapA family protein [Bacillota bacterium]
MQIILVLALVFALFVAIFAIQNATTVSIILFAWQFETSLVVVILSAAILGALSAGLFGLVRYIQWQMKLKRKRDKIRELESKLTDLEAKIETEEEPVISVNEGSNTQSKVKEDLEQEIGG